MIIDIHGHYTTAPAPLRAYRANQIGNLGRPTKGSVNISDEQIRASLEQSQVKQQRERGTAHRSERVFETRSRLLSAISLHDKPDVALPLDRSDQGLPIGVQIAGRPWEEERVLAVAAVVEQAGGWKSPPAVE